jgi:hypothetical protein
MLELKGCERRFAPMGKICIEGFFLEEAERLKWEQMVVQSGVYMTAKSLNQLQSN